MAATSLVMAPVATWHWLAGWVRLPWLLADRSRAPRPDLPAAAAQPGPLPTPARPVAVLFDRDGTLVADVPYNGDPGRVSPVPGAAEALGRLRAAGCRLALVSNQSAIGRGLLTRDQVEAVNARTAQLLDGFDAVVYCPHAPADGCACRKPAPGMLLEVARRLGVAPERCAMIGDIGADVQAARAAGMRAVLVPTPETRRAEIVAAPEVASELSEAVDRLLGEAA
jgi:histidinol-phosphate phosphatase family protein